MPQGPEVRPIVPRAHEGPCGQKQERVHCLRESSDVYGHPKAPHEDAHWRETVPVRVLREKVHHSATSKNSSASSH